MTRDQSLETLNGIFRAVFNDSSIEVKSETTADDVDGWDSLSHIQLVTAVEEHFSIKFKLREIMKFKNVGDMCESIEKQVD